jgi:tetratricopeptide (TPR) repeat protein
MRARGLLIAVALLAAGSVPAAGAPHDAGPGKFLGTVSFKTSCDAAVAHDFNQAVAALHSFVYGPAHAAFARIAERDPHCAMALWGMAMTHYHPLWEPQVDSEAEMREGADEARRAAAMPGTSPREAQFIAAIGQYYLDWEHTAPAARAQRYAAAMTKAAADNTGDDEAQIFYALSLIATASPMDKSHANNLRAAAILEPMWRRLPQHPGLPHYLIHAYDSPELASRGLVAARAYSKIAPSAPHAQHMPAHIFTRLGLWRESAASNEAARAAAEAQGDIGEELHAMDYLTYAYLQLGRYDDAARVVAKVKAMTALPTAAFKVSYAANAMPVRLAVERRDWAAAAQLTPLAGTTPRVAAIIDWARALGHSRAATPSDSSADIAALSACLDALRASGDAYWAMQAEVMLKEADGWRLAAAGKPDEAVASLRAAADEEDAVEKLPVTPGPIVPAREQLGELLLQLHRPADAIAEFNAALNYAPGRRGALVGLAAARKALAAEGSHRAG